MIVLVVCDDIYFIVSNVFGALLPASIGDRTLTLRNQQFRTRQRSFSNMSCFVLIVYSKVGTCDASSWNRGSVVPRDCGNIRLFVTVQEPGRF